MQLVSAIIRPERVGLVVTALEESGYLSYSKWSIAGRGKQKGIQVGDVYYEEMPKTMIYLVVEDEGKDEVVDIIMETARSGENGNSGDGRIFVNPVAECYTISSQEKDH